MRESGKKVALISFLSVILLGSYSVSLAQEACETPDSNKAVLFQPATWLLGNDSGPLKDVADHQNYNYVELNDDSANVLSFCNLSGVGILQIGATHGSDSGRLMLEAYKVDTVDLNNPDTNTAKWLLSWLNLRTQGFGRDEIRPVAGENSRGIRYVGIDITETGIRNRWTGANSIVFVGACYSMKLRFSEAFNPREYFGYWWISNGVLVRHDATLLFNRMDGVNGIGLRPAGDAFDEGGFSPLQEKNGKRFGEFRHASTADGRTTLAPAVLEFDPSGTELMCGSQYEGHVTFDTKMDTTIPAAQVVDFQDNSCNVAMQDQRWSSDNRIDFTLVVPGYCDGSTTLKVVSTNALSQNNQRELDGNQNPAGSDGRGPNQDDWVSKENPCTPTLNCGLPEVHSVVGQPSSWSSSYLKYPQDTIDIVEDSVRVLGIENNETRGLFSIKNTNGLPQYNVMFTSTDIAGPGGLIPKENVSFIPQSIDTLAPGNERLMVVSVDIPPDLASGDYEGEISVPGFGTDVLTLKLTVDQPPILYVPDTSLLMDFGDTLQFSVTAADPDGDSVYVWAGLYPINALWESIESDSGVFTFVPDTFQEGVSFEEVVFFASDGIFNSGQCVAIGLPAGVEEEDHGMVVSHEFYLAQNEPNPFSAQTSISYTVAEESNVTLTIYDVSGREARILINETKQTGLHKVYWDGLDDKGLPLPSGVYFYKLVAGCYTATRSAILLR